LVLLILFGLLHVRGAQLHPLLPPGGALMGPLAGAMLPVLFAFDGWINAAALAEEIREPQRNLPLALIGGLLAVGLIYLLLNVAVLGVLGFGAVTAAEKPVVAMAHALFGSLGGQLITIGMLVSMFGTLNGIALTAPRYYFAMARDGLFPFQKQLTWLHPTWSTPIVAQLLTAIAAAILLVGNSFGQLLNLIVFVIWLEVALAIGAVFRLRRKQPDLPRPYRAIGYPVVPLLALGAAAWVVYAAFAQDPQTAVKGIILVLAGLPLFYWTKWTKRQGAPETVTVD
jgi:APA family basic amino acid/polyamine antiporter